GRPHPRRAAPGGRGLHRRRPGRRDQRTRGRPGGGDRRRRLPRRRRGRAGGAMKPLEFPVRNYQFTVVLFVMLAALGVSAWLSIPRGEDPPLHVPTFTVIAVYPGGSATDLERLVVKPVEDRLHGLDNVKKIESLIQDGVATVTIEFEADQNPDDRYEE